MGLFFIYSLKVAICLIAFYLLYKLLLSRETFFRFNRIMLLAILVLSLIIPTIDISTGNQVMTAINLSIPDEIVIATTVDTPETPTLSLAQVAFMIYILGMVFFTARSIFSFFSLYRLISNGRMISHINGIRTIVVKEKISPFSWMNYIVINEEDLADDSTYILEHERAHITSHHSIDMVLCELLTIFQWYNPSAWLLKNEMQDVHEYEADRKVISSGIDAKTYQLLLIRKSVGNKMFSMANNLNKSSLKKRITMMKKKKSNPRRCIRAFLFVPVAAVATMALATPTVKDVSYEIKNDNEKLIKAVISETQTLQKTETTSAIKAQNETEKTNKQSFTLKNTNDTTKVNEAPKNMEMPEFPGGMKAMMKWLSENVKYPESAYKAGIEGRVIVQFVVDTDGSVTEPSIVRGVDKAIDDEVIRLVKTMPKWTPGKENGKIVPVKYTIPVTFNINGGSTDISKSIDTSKGGNIHLTGNLLYVVDGKVVDNINEYKVEDIEKVEVKNDKASTTDKYGDAAKNGVVYITMKKK